ncbi:MAG: hypothetical protein E7677_05870 [Ruminococcaceae bacterium]|nr:hypothetical protein [Oscillospiraceae bacterium]
MKRLFIVFSALAVLLSDVMCAVVAYNYRGLLCGIEHKGFSAPADIVFLLAIPFLALIAGCAFLAVVFYRRSKKK